MKKKKTIIIKDPKLRKIRNNLRALLIAWSNKLWFQFNDEYKKIHYTNDGKVRHSSDYSPKERDKVQYSINYMKRIESIVDNSICKCSVCGAPDKDMTYNPVEKRWFCVDCYKINQDFYKDTDEAYLYP